MKRANNKSTENAIRSGRKSRALKRLGTFPLFLSIFLVVFILGCVSILPRSPREEQPPATVQPTLASPTIQPSLVPVTETQESECTRLNLTSQECANLGEHWFTLSGVVDGFCWYGTDDKTVTRDFVITVSFSQDGSGMKAIIEDGVFIDCATSSRSRQNTYTYDCIANDSNHHTGTITFVDNGFLNEGGFTNSVNKNCTWSESYKLFH